MGALQPSRRMPWDMQKGETSKSYKAFEVYLSLGADRSITKVAKELQKSYGYATFLRKWSSKFEWVDRARAYDSWELQQQIEQRGEMRERTRNVFMSRARQAAELLAAHAMLPLLMMECEALGIEPPPLLEAAGKLDYLQIRSLKYIVEQSGVCIPRKLELTGADGGPLATLDMSLAMMSDSDLDILDAQLVEHDEETDGST